MVRIGRLSRMIWIVSFLPLAAWLYLLFGRGFFWLTRERDDRDAPAPEHWPSVAAVVPARNEADVIARSAASLLAQDYPGPFRVILVDDQSDDGTGDAARALGGKPRRGLWRAASARLDGKALGGKAGYRPGGQRGLSVADRCGYRAHAQQPFQTGGAHGSRRLCADLARWRSCTAEMWPKSC